MVFSFRRRRESRTAQAAREYVEERNRARKASSARTVRSEKAAPVTKKSRSESSLNAKKVVQNTQSKSKNFKSPLVTIVEAKGEADVQTGETEASTPPAGVISNLNIISGEEDDFEVVWGSVQPSKVQPSQVQPSQVQPSQVQPSQVQPNQHDDIKKQLFRDEPEEEADEREKPEPFHDPKSMELHVVPEEDEEEEEPFDAKDAMVKEDPHILEVIRSESKDEEEGPGRIISRKFSSEGRLGISAFKPPEPVQEERTPGSAIAQKVIDAFSCSGDSASMFYDTMCAEPKLKKRKRPFFNEEFAIEFIKESIEDGIPMLYHVPPTNPVDNDWTGQSMTMFIRPGDCEGPKLVQPRLEWTTQDGGWSRLTSQREAITISVGILEIHAIMDTMGESEDAMDDDEDLYFFSITRDNGEVYLFECTSETERDRVVSGIKNILARMSFSIIAGDDIVAKELYGADDDEVGDLPSLRTPSQTLAGVTHAFLDAGAAHV